MKVLFAVSNDSISESIVKRYQKDYKEIVTYKNVYYFNAILKEIQKDKTYDRIVISEELEAFANTQYEQIDKFIFDKLDNISDEASDIKGDNIPIILITSDRRTKGEEMLVKIFGIGIYDALIGTDRNTDQVCRLLNKPRSKKEAKEYYKIESDEVNYQTENENDVSEQEIQNILAHYKKLGKNEDKYVTSFNNIVAQYNDAQLRIISKFLPLNVRAVLEEKSPKYQQIMAFNNSVTDRIRKPKNNEETDLGPSGTLLKTNNNVAPREPIVIPSAVNTANVKKLTRKKESPVVNTQNNVNKFEQRNIGNNNMQNNVSNTNASNNDVNTNLQQNKIAQIDQISQDLENIFSSDNEINNQEPRRRGRPRKQVNAEESVKPIQTAPRKRGRPRKNPIAQEENVLPQIETVNDNGSILPGFDEPEDNNSSLLGFEELNTNNSVLPGFDEPKNNDSILPGFDEPENDDSVLPGFDEPENNDSVLPGFEEPENDDSVLPGFDELENDDASVLPGFNEPENNNDSPLPGFENFNNDYNPMNDFGSMNNDYNPMNDFGSMNNNYNPMNDFENTNNDYNPMNNFENTNNDYNPMNNFENTNNDYNPSNNFENMDDNYNQSNEFESIDNNYSQSNEIENTDDNNYNQSNNFESMNNNYNQYNQYNQYSVQESNTNYESNVDISKLLTSDKKIVSFVGTSKNGTSFILNNLAEYASSIGINVAILDTTKNKNSYYIYTKNEEELRQVAEKCLDNLIQGQAKGISANTNLTVYTSLPEDRDNLNNVGPILETLVRNHSLILIDCDFDTPYEYFAYAQDICLVQSLDILTIQPLTAFLRELKAHNVLDENKIKIILNKYVRVRGISEKTIIGGMSKYTDPAMSFMTDLFDINNAVRNSMTVQFEQDIYARYLESVIDCDVSIKGYSKTFLQKLKDLCNWFYPNASGSNTYRPPAAQTYNNTFSASMNDTLNQMKRKY